jgi:hypothetical protein
MAKKTDRESIKTKLMVGPGFGLFFMGLSYLLFWLTPAGINAFNYDPRWAHNWAYAIIIIIVGLSWYQKSPISRFVALVQSFTLPLTASGSFNALTMTYITVIIGLVWFVLVAIEKFTRKMLFQRRFSKRSWNWINLHTLLIAWILLGHMGLVFFVGRLPQELSLLALNSPAGFLINLPSEIHEASTWAFNITLIIWVIIVLYEQFKMGYNIQEKPWPKGSFYFIFVCMLAGFLTLFL